MYAAQEMFKTANKVTRPEKALILGFMAGSRGTHVTHRHLLQTGVKFLSQAASSQVSRLNIYLVTVRFNQFFNKRAVRTEKKKP